MSQQLLIPPVKGTRDFYPEDQAFQNWLYSKFKEVAERFGFQEYEGPILESLDLYAAKSGEELVKRQAFILKDQAENILALRPEMTPTLARMIAQKSGELTFPVKWFTY
ncbi:MAG: ATP phosphoribosyltransferase regulatory subunit, partial [Microgenomates group bacterium]